MGFVFGADGDHIVWFSHLEKPFSTFVKLEHPVRRLKYNVRSVFSSPQTLASKYGRSISHLEFASIVRKNLKITKVFRFCWLYHYWCSFWETKKCVDVIRGAMRWRRQNVDTDLSSHYEPTELLKYNMSCPCISINIRERNKRL